MESERLLSIVRCPETHESLTPLETNEIERLNMRIGAGEIMDQNGRLVDAPIDGGLLRADGSVVYPLRDKVYNFYITDRLLVLKVASSEEE